MVVCLSVFLLLGFYQYSEKENKRRLYYCAGAGIILEQKSVSTEENLKFSRELMNKQNPQIVIVTTAYHMLRALILAKRQGIRCVGFGAKTKWYFMLNAFIREFVGYLKLTWKKHIIVIGITVCIVIAWYGLKSLFL